MTECKTPGQLAYEAELVARRHYENGAPRKQWHELGKPEQSTWEHNPTPRWKS